MDIFDVTQAADGMVTLLAVAIFASGAIGYLIVRGVGKLFHLTD